MIISELRLYDFRRFHSDNGAPGLEIYFHKGLNALIGENDSGKSAVIDALKLVLMTQSNEFVRPVEEDFYTVDGLTYVDEFRIECVITDFTSNEAKNFIEYLVFSNGEAGLQYSLHLFFRAWREKNRIFTELRINDPADGITLDSKARDLLRAVYLRPLRDAEREMHSGRNSRLSQILMSHRVFQGRENHTLKGILEKANNDIEKYFTEDEGQEILQAIRSNLTAFHESSVSGEASIMATDVQLKSILEKLSLNAPEIHPGLGELNLVFIAAELLLLKQDDIGGLKLALIEELEAHLHPQAQLRLISYLQKEYDEAGTQIIISTHSSILVSKINLKNIVLLKGGKGYSLAEGRTGLDRGDYLFLQRFLDTTKANLFFAKGVIMVEGDAENLLLPIIADIIGYPLERYGISIVNVGSKAFLRYSRIFIRGDQRRTIDIPVSVITDCDVKPYDEVKKVFCERLKDSENEVARKKKYYSIGSVRGFISPRWTLEYCIAMSFLGDLLHQAINYGKKIKNSDRYTLTSDKIIKADKEAESEKAEWTHLEASEQAYRLYGLMLGESGQSGLKAIVAQCLASLLRMKTLEEPILTEKMFDLDLYQCRVDEKRKAMLKDEFMNDPYLKFIVDAIRYAAGVNVSDTKQEEQADAGNPR